MKQILLHNWKIKLACLMLASVVWYVIQQNLNPGNEGRTRTPTSERDRK